MKKIYPLIFLLNLIYFTPIWAGQPAENNLQNQPPTQELSFPKNHIISQDFPAENIKNLTIKTTYETVEFSEIYGTEIAVDIYSNNNTLIPEIVHENDTLSITSSVIKDTKKSTPGDRCRIIIYLPKDTWLENLNILSAPELFTPELTELSKVSAPVALPTPRPVAPPEDTNKTSQETFVIPEIKAHNTTIETINANITGKNLTGSIIIKTKNGNITLDNIIPQQITKTKAISQAEIQLYATSKTGKITVNNFNGHYISLKTGNNITARAITASFFETKTTDGNIILTLKNAPIATSQIITKTGSIQLFMPKDASFTIKVRSPRGTFADKIQNQRKNRPNLTKKYKNGGPVINLETTTGNIELKNF